jgi:NAD(P)-dependent dehydrogenase (short-subunit alcohol dehydrogenase family)
MRLENKVAIVTGGGRGIGRAITHRFAREGAEVVIAEVDLPSANQTFAEIDRRGLLVPTDMAKLADIDALVAKTIEKFGRVDILVNNAGVTKRMGFFDVTESDWDWMYAINTKGLFFCMQRTAREMVKQQSGKIVNIASVGGKGSRGTSNIAYAGSKGAVITMTRVAASQLARYKINVNSVCPGSTLTPMHDRFMKLAVVERGISEEELQRSMDSSIPLGRSNTPEDIANVAAFLASPETDNITGQSINVDGGMVWD